jgi:hypothetical protein
LTPGGTGLLLLSPLRRTGPGGKEIVPRRLGFLLSAKSAEELEELDGFLR